MNFIKWGEKKEKRDVNSMGLMSMLLLFVTIVSKIGI